MSFGAPKSDEARKMCERAEYYFEKITKRELRFTQEAESVKVYDVGAKENVSMPTYFWRRKGEYDRNKVDEAELRIKAESSPELEQVGPYLKTSSYPSMLDSARKLRFLIARHVLSLIDEALTRPTPLIEEGEAFFSKLEECEKQRKILVDERDRTKAELQELSTEYISLQALYDECQRKLHIKPI